MGEMAMRTRPRKDLVASFHRLRRTVIDVKNARKSLAAHHSLVAELVSVAFYSSSKDPVPCSRLQPDDPQEENVISLASLPPSNPPARRPCPPSQPDDLQEMGIETQRSLPSSLSTAPRNPSFPFFGSLALKISASFSCTSNKNDEISCPNPSHQETDSSCSKILASAAYPGIRLTQPAFWASLFSVFLCFFLYTGKEIAVVVAICAYIIIRLTRRFRIVQRQCSDNHYSVNSVSYDEDHHGQEMAGSNLGRSSTIPKRVSFCSSDTQAPTRSHSCPTLCTQEEVCFKEPDFLLYPQLSATTSRASENFSARLKLSLILVLALCGLAYSHFIAVCLCSSCIFLLSRIDNKKLQAKFIIFDAGVAIDDAIFSDQHDQQCS
ncbi:hypothetical protein GOP47_0028808 [Adiantum capillus-veneris]|nr:hypothetical protein GOP47_0028808 [Adiantum capillus-veneris]